MRKERSESVCVKEIERERHSSLRLSIVFLSPSPLFAKNLVFPERKRDACGMPLSDGR